jgi:hypothetical protein
MLMRFTILTFALLVAFGSQFPAQPNFSVIPDLNKKCYWGTYQNCIKHCTSKYPQANCGAACNNCNQ